MRLVLPTLHSLMVGLSYVQRVAIQATARPLATKESCMDLYKSGGPAYPTLNGASLDDNTFRFEGMTLWDYYVGQALAGGAGFNDAMARASIIIKKRQEILTADQKPKGELT